MNPPAQVSPPRASGFTLIEVLVALLIVAFGMGAVMTALTSSAQSTMRLREKSFAEWIGFNQLAAARLQRTLPATGKTEGDVDFANGKWHWQQQVEDAEIPGVKRITIQVRHAADKGDDWLATVFGFRGDALSTPLGVLPGWDNASAVPGGPTPAPGTPGATPVTSPPAAGG